MGYFHYYHSLGRAQQQLYQTVYEGLSRGDTCIPCTSLPPSQISPVIKALLMDNPHLCHFEGKWEYSSGIVPCYTQPLHHIALVCQEAERIHAQLAAHGGDYPQAVYLWLLEHVHYEPDAPCSQTTWGALIHRSAVCKGIAKAFQLLLQLQGIPCILVDGTLDGISRHMWNMFWMDGAWHHADVTMGYPQFRHFVGCQDNLGGYRMNPAHSHTILYPHLLPACQEE